ncbi:Zn-ribbon domain-containing OB-fold protein [Rhodococcus sp. WAY2]|uniref:Zn-ribbon domain-containing OB-fold protein n=1 Tax=Rhodococcus sp. WAY2 TaxID=2663121 RepID=UPI001359D906|nr:OB-fold domain-containing protein [Rhodococcus sp. WAY2]
MIQPPSEWHGPVPAIQPESEGFWSALKEHRLCIQRCLGCATWIHYPLPSCAECGSDRLEFEQVSGRGSLYSYTVVHREFGLRLPLPYVSAYVTLDDVPEIRLSTNIIGCEPEKLGIGMPVRVAFVDYNNADVTLAYFEPAEPATTRGAA